MLIPVVSPLYVTITSDESLYAVEFSAGVMASSFNTFTPIVVAPPVVEIDESEPYNTVSIEEGVKSIEYIVSVFLYVITAL